LLSSSQIPLNEFNQTNVHETQVSRYGDSSQKYDWHCDSDNKKRIITIVYYFHKEPKKYKGGEIELSRSPSAFGKIVDDNKGKDLFNSIVDGIENIEKDRPTQWTELNSDDIFDMFHTFINYDEPSLDLSKFDFRTHTAEWYKEKYPHFPDNFYGILEEASKVKIDDKRDNGLKKIDKVTTLKFD